MTEAVPNRNADSS